LKWHFGTSLRNGNKKSVKTVMGRQISAPHCE